MEQVYSINWNRFVALQVPSFLRKAKLLAYLNALIVAVAHLHVAFLAFRRQALYKVNHNSQICYLQAVLNDSFDNVQRRIVIRNAILREPVWFYEPEENKPVWFYEASDNKPVYFREENEFVGDGADFLVVMPIALQPIAEEDNTALEIQIKGQIDYYKLFVKNYKIVWV